MPSTFVYQLLAAFRFHEFRLGMPKRFSRLPAKRSQSELTTCSDVLCRTLRGRRHRVTSSWSYLQEA